MANNNKMLIDASHPEETRVVVLRNSRVDEFDFEAASKKQLRGNIYLAKVIRVEPSLQAAFVDYGGNRHGFLAFSEIHPDYYQIPVADRQALLEEEARSQRSEEEDEGERRERRSRRHRRRGERPAEKRRAHGDATLSGDVPNGDAAEARDEIEAATLREEGDAVAADQAPVPVSGEGVIETAALREEGHAVAAEDAPVPAHAMTEEAPRAASAAEPAAETSGDMVAAPQVETVAAEAAAVESVQDDVAQDESDQDESDEEDEESDDEESDEEDSEEEEGVEQMGGDAMEEVPHRQTRLRRQYKIQEVIKRRQVLLVQVVKEERGNKGAALTTYLSLAGRYSVLMPNTARGGGISRKITDASDRKRLKEIAHEMEVPQGMGVIVRTAGAARTRAEIHRDFEYLMRMWEQVRETTLASSAPTLVYEEGSIIKRAIRDLYTKDIEEVVVAGPEGFKEARDFMRMLMPSHAKFVRPYNDAQPIFARSGVEHQLDGLFSNQVTLKSGGYIVINQTEALVAIDVNSGRSTREHNIEDTALRTNMEAADEVARQLRLRDLAGLIVVDFIDMEENRNNRAVERRIKEALKNDRARIQIGRISHFGLLEMSRQRIRTGVLEGSTVLCPHCMGAGSVRSTSSIALHVLRILEDALIRSATHDMIVRTRTAVALYILNQKREHLRALESRFGVSIIVTADESLSGTSYHALERGELATGTPEPRQIIEGPAEDESVFEAEEDFVEEPREERGETAGEDAEGRDDEEGEDGQRGRRRRRRRRGRNDREPSGVSADAPQPSDEGLALVAAIDPVLGALEPVEDGELAGDEAESGDEAEGAEGDAENGRRRRRSRRGGRGRTRRDGRREDEAAPAEGEQPAPTGEWHAAEAPAEAKWTNAAAQAAPVEADSGWRPGVSDWATPPAADSVAPAAASLAQTVSEPAAPEAPSAVAAEEPAQKPQPVSSPVVETANELNPEPAPSPDEPPRPKRSGWWQRAKASFGGS